MMRSTVKRGPGNTASACLRLAVATTSLVHAAAAAQEAEPGFRPWAARVTVTGTWSPHEQFWIDSAGRIVYANMGNPRAIPCVADASASTVAAIERSLSSFLSRDIGEPAGSDCRDDPLVGLLLAHTPADGTGTRFTERGFSDVPSCRQQSVAEDEESIATLVRGAAEALKAACPVPMGSSQTSVTPWTVRMNLRVSPAEPNEDVDSQRQRNETYWVNSGGEIAVADLANGLEVPCVGTADPETVATIESDLTQLLAQPPGEQGSSICWSTEYVYLEIASAGTGLNPEVQNGFAEDPDCRRRPIPRQMDDIFSRVREAGAAAKAICLANR